MATPEEKARQFLQNEQAFRLGTLLTESFHPKTNLLSQMAKTNLRSAISMLQTVDAEIPPMVRRVISEPVFCQLTEAFEKTLCSGNKVFFTGCGATGRLAILLEAAWRRFWYELVDEHPKAFDKLPDLSDHVLSVMAGGDFALIKSVEGFEDFPGFGRHQLVEAGVSEGDLVVAITEGGETPFVIGTAWQGLEFGADVFFVYNNPTKQLAENVERSRRVIEEPRIKKLDLTTGPMAVAGSTRMQATTAELLVVGTALETALVNILKKQLGPAGTVAIGIRELGTTHYHYRFTCLLSQLAAPASVAAMMRLIEFEEQIYRRHGLITYAADDFMLDVLTDTTERSPTFMVPPFRKFDDSDSPASWAFVKNFGLPSVRAWRDMLQREPRGLEWTDETYERLNAPADLRNSPPALNNDEIHKFLIGNEPDASRTDCPASALIAIAAGETADPRNQRPVKDHLHEFDHNAAIVIGGLRAVDHTETLFGFPCQLLASPLKLWHHLAIKLVLNTVSTATMVRMDRVIGNAMVWLSPSNKKLIDRGCRLISQQTNCTYEQACFAMHEAIDRIQSHSEPNEEPPSPVALAIRQIQSDQGKG